MTTMVEVATTLQTLWPRAKSLTKNRPEAEDLMQDTFVQAARYIDTFHDGSLGAWLNTMMYRLFLTSRRTGAGSAGKYTYRQRTISIESMPGFDIPCQPTAEAEWDCERLLTTVSQLTPTHRLAIEMIADGATYDEIASAMGCGVTTVKTRLNRARAKLKLKLAA